MKPKSPRLETVFFVSFAVLTFVLFFSLISGNGLILGNDPAVHLQQTNMMLLSGRISLGDIAWYPPLYHILLATFMAFTGATSIDQILLLMKTLTALIDVLLLFSVYLLGTKFFGKKTGVLASMLVLLCFPLYEINFWGGYTNVVGLAFMVLLFVYLSLAKTDLAGSVVIFVFSFSMVLSHQLATFLAFLILPPFVLVLLIRSRGHHSKALIMALLGGLAAFFIYYFQAIVPHIDILIEHVFFQIRTNIYQLPYVSASAFAVNFGFILVFGITGMFLAFIKLRKEHKLLSYLLLFLSVLVPFLCSQSYLFGMYLPYHMFVYYLVPSLAVFAAVSFSSIIDFVFTYYSKNRNLLKRRFPKAASICIVVILVSVLFFRFETVTGKIGESISFYSTSDMDAYRAGMWLKETYPDSSTVVVTEKPGYWFGAFSGKYVIAQTALAVDRNVVAESVLDLAYEMEHPLTLVRAYESKDNISEENYISVNGIWRRTSYLSEDSSYVSFRENNGVLCTFALSGLNKEIALDNASYPKKLEIRYSNEEFTLTENVLVQNDSYPLTVTWTLFPVKTTLNYVVLYICNYFDLSFSFKNAYISGVLNSENPWSAPSKIGENNEWVITDFSRQNLTDSYVGIYDYTNQAEFAVNFTDKPNSGNIGALTNRQIDALRFQYQFSQVNVGQTVSSTYQILTFPMSSFPVSQQPEDLGTLLDAKAASVFDVKCRNYADYIRELNIDFLVYDSKDFDRSLLRSGLLQLVYSNNGYVICKIKNGS